jgi:hypothetical protein
MKTSKQFAAILVCTVFLTAILVPTAFVRAFNTSINLTSWSQTSSLPVFAYQQSCVESSNYYYCVGGNDGSSDLSSVEYANLTSSGAGSWSNTTSYPFPITQQSCAASSGYIYCVAGNSNGPIDSVYYASLSSSGVGQWQSTTRYPLQLWGESCVTNSGYIYCVGGFNGNVVNKVYYAKLTSNGVGNWQQTTNYPIDVAFESCVTVPGYIYCIAGTSDENYGQNATDAVYYAPLPASGVGTWTSAPNYPLKLIYPSCVVNSGIILMCVGGENNNFTNGFETADVYYTSFNSTGVAPWQQTTSYADAISAASCVSDSNYVYCSGGGGSPEMYAVYYSKIVFQTETSVGCAPAKVEINSSSSSVTCEAEVMGFDPTGAVNWYLNASSSPFSHCALLDNDSCSITFMPDKLGILVLSANYTGDANNSPSLNASTIDVVKVLTNTIGTTIGTNTASMSTHENPTPLSTYWLLAIGGVVVLVAVVTTGGLFYLRKFRK